MLITRSIHKRGIKSKGHKHLTVKKVVTKI